MTLSRECGEETYSSFFKPSASSNKLWHDGRRTIPRSRQRELRIESGTESVKPWYAVIPKLLLGMLQYNLEDSRALLPLESLWGSFSCISRFALCSFIQSSLIAISQHTAVNKNPPSTVARSTSGAAPHPAQLQSQDQH